MDKVKSFRLDKIGYSSVSIKCLKCCYEGKAKKGRKNWIHLFFLIGGLLTYGVLWIIWIFYIILTKPVICPACSSKEVARLDV